MIRPVCSDPRGGKEISARSRKLSGDIHYRRHVALARGSCCRPRTVSPSIAKRFGVGEGGLLLNIPVISISSTYASMCQLVVWEMSLLVQIGPTRQESARPVAKGAILLMDKIESAYALNKWSQIGLQSDEVVTVR